MYEHEPNESSHSKLVPLQNDLVCVCVCICSYFPSFYQILFLNFLTEEVFYKDKKQEWKNAHFLLNCLFFHLGSSSEILFSVTRIVNHLQVEVITVKLGMVTVSDMKMHHVLIIIYIDLDHSFKVTQIKIVTPNKCFII